MLDIRITEKDPTGESGMKALIERMGDGMKKTDDMSETFRKLVPDIQDILRYEFSDANPANWDALLPSYVRWKREHGYPTTIGIMTGTLKKAVTDDAIVTIEPHKIIYGMNQSMTDPDSGETTGDYGPKFAEKRPIMIYVKTRIRELIKAAVRESIAFGRRQGRK